MLLTISKEFENHLTEAKIFVMEIRRPLIELPIALIEEQSFVYFRSSISAYYEEHVRVCCDKSVDCHAKNITGLLCSPVSVMILHWRYRPRIGSLATAP